MSLVGELVSLLVSLSQEIGIIAGVGALTITLVGRLLSLHARNNETVLSYVRAARSIRALALIVIIVSGGAATLVHFQAGTPDILVAPAYLFKWLIIAALTAFYFVELKVDGIRRDAVEGFEGANWYALFIIHATAPVVGWGLLLGIYAGWLAVFALIWAGFVWLMRRQGGAALKPAPKPAAAISDPAPKPAPAAAKQPVPPPAPKPTAPQVPPPAAPAADKKIEIHPNHSLLPMIAELDLPAPLSGEAQVPKGALSIPTEPAPAPVAPAPLAKPQPPAAPAPEAPKAAVKMTNLDETGLPALHVMPKRPEDIESSKRGPVVKMSDE